MQLLFFIFAVLFTFVDTLLFYRHMGNRFAFRFSRPAYIPVFTCTYLVSLVVSANLFPDYPLRLPISIIYLLLIFLVHKGNSLQKFLWIIIFHFTILPCEMIVILVLQLLLQLIPNENLANILYSLVGFVLSRTAMWLIINYLGHTKKELFKGFRKEFFLIMIIDVVYCIIIVNLFYGTRIFLSTETAITLSLFVMFLITFLALYLLRKITKKSEEIMTTNLKLQQIEMEHKQNRDMAIVVEDLRSLRHDMNNHMSVLQGLLTMEEYEDAKNYLSTITEELTVANSFVFVDNKILSVLINNKISKARQLGITLETEFLTTATPFSDSDLCAVLGNILENAIEASSNHDNPYIYFSMSKQDNCLLIQCDNTYTIPPVFEKGHLVTTKADKAYHGIGTKTICSVVEGYHGTTRFTVDELFHVNISVPM